jgi:hypothetical protein
MGAEQNLSKKCFVISPIDEEGTPVRAHADLVFDEIIEPVMRGEGYQAYRSDHIDLPVDIMDLVIKEILGADIVVALLTGGNANLYYELAVSHTLKKPTIQMIQKGDPLYFDVRHQNTIKFNPEDVDSISQARTALKEQVLVLDHNPGAISNPVRRVLDPLSPIHNLGINITKEMIIRKLEDLSETNLRKVLDLVEHLNGKSDSGSGDDPILSVIGLFTDEPLSSRDIDRELYGEFEVEGRA